MKESVTLYSKPCPWICYFVIMGNFLEMQILRSQLDLGNRLYFHKNRASPPPTPAPTRCSVSTLKCESPAVADVIYAAFSSFQSTLEVT